MVECPVENCKPKKKLKSIEEILGIPKSSKKGRRGRRKEQKCVVIRSAIGAAALSVSFEDYLGNDEEVISKIMVTDEEDELRKTLLAHQSL